MKDQPRFSIDKRQRRRAFEKAAQTYDSAAVLQNEVADRLLNRLDVIKHSPKTVLDIGTGTGKAIPALQNRYRGAQVLALDIALPMLHKTRSRCGWLRRPELLCADAESLPLVNASVDLIFSNLTLQWVNDLAATLREFRRILAPGGLAMFTTLGPDTLKELRHCWSQVDQHVHVNAFTDMHDIGDLLLEAGFNQPVVDMEMMCLTYTDVLQLMRELKLLGAQNKTLGRPSGLMGKGRLEKLIKTYETYRTPQGVMPSSYEVIYGHAWALEKKPPMPATIDKQVEIPISLQHLKSKKENP